MGRHTVLVVDDDEQFLEEAKASLVAVGHVVLTASTGLDAMILAKKYRPSVILLDKKLPDMDGQSAIPEIRSFSPESEFIIVTAYGDLPSACDGVREGVIDYITKPADQLQLLASVKEAINRRENEREKAEKAEKKIGEFKKLDALKSEFVANAAHELLGPLGIIRESMSLIEENLLRSGNETVLETLAISKKELNRLIKFTRNMLDLSKIEAGKKEVNPAFFDPAAFLKDVVDLVRMKAYKRNINIDVDASDLPAQMFADSDILKAILINLLDNAEKHSPNDKKIHVKAFKKEDSIQFEVKDEGNGISMNSREKIFDKYHRISQEKTEGTGLGLSIVRELVQLCGGSVSLESEIGKGSSFIVTMPVKGGVS